MSATAPSRSSSAPIRSAQDHQNHQRAILAAARVNVLGQRRGGRVHHVQAGNAPRRGHETGPQAVAGEHLSEPLEPVQVGVPELRGPLGLLGFHHHSSDTS